MSNEGERRVDNASRPKGRGAADNPRNRFESTDVEYEIPRPDRVATQVLPDASRTILARNQSPDVFFDRSINPYRGCEHGCAYCYARPTHEYLGFSAGLDFETRILVKHEAATLLRRELMRPRYTPAPVALSGVTDPYQPLEKRLRITRACLDHLPGRADIVLQLDDDHAIRSLHANNEEDGNV